MNIRTHPKGANSCGEKSSGDFLPLSQLSPSTSNIDKSSKSLSFLNSSDRLTHRDKSDFETETQGAIWIMKNSYDIFKCQFRDGYVKEAMLLTVFLYNSNNTAVAIAIRFLIALALFSKYLHIYTRNTSRSNVCSSFSFIVFNFYYK